GDELLGGYARTALVAGRAGAWTRGYEPLRARIEAAGADPAGRMRAAFDRSSDLTPLLAPDFVRALGWPVAAPMLEDASLLRSVLWEERNGTLRSLLHVEDRVSMAHGLEGRPVGCLGELPAVAAALPDAWLVGPDGEGKRALRAALKGFIPESVRTDPRKRGFPTPFARAARGAGRERVLGWLHDRQFTDRGWWNVDACRALLEDERPAWDRALFAVLSWEWWARWYLDGEAYAPHDGAGLDGKRLDRKGDEPR
ncbi:MAG: asparagine synthase-related protein, partial [Planctomycetota bacterium]|nr:asparagine synthase-related protein [Planctomycetota bacterium]